MNTIYCKKTKQQGTQLQTPPYPGAIGERIHAHICATAWQDWLNHQTMLINEHRLSLIEPQARSFLEQEMLAFLFEGGAEKPAGFTPPDE